MDPDPTPDPTPFFSDFKDAKKLIFFFILSFSYNSPTGTLSLVWTPEPDPYLWLMDSEPGGPKTFGSGSPTLEGRIKKWTAEQKLATFQTTKNVTVFFIKDESIWCP
jgi:hypothetical protein